MPQLSLFSFSKLSRRIKINEGFKTIVYKDQTGNLTIGYGHLIKPSERFIHKKKYSKEVLNKLFHNDLNYAIYCFKKYYNTKALPQNVQEVIIEMIFQIGIKGTLNFKKFNKNIQNKLYYLAALEMMKSCWYHQTPKRVEKLIYILLQNNAKQKRK